MEVAEERMEVQEEALRIASAYPQSFDGPKKVPGLDPWELVWASI